MLRPAEEKALFAQQEAVLGEFYKAVAAMGRGEWDSASERFQELIDECEKQRAKLDRDFQDLSMKEFRSRLDEAFLRAAENPRSNEAISKSLEYLKPEGEDQNGEEK